MVEHSLMNLQPAFRRLFETEQLFWALLHGGGENRGTLTLISSVFFARCIELVVLQLSAQKD